MFHLLKAGAEIPAAEPRDEGTGLMSNETQVPKKATVATAPDQSRGDEEHARIIAETASDAIITIDGDSTILFANRAAESLFGYQLDELLGNSLTMLMPEYLRHVHR